MVREIRSVNNNLEEVKRMLELIKVTGGGPDAGDCGPSCRPCDPLCGPDEGWPVCTPEGLP